MLVEKIVIVELGDCQHRMADAKRTHAYFIGPSSIGLPELVQ